MLSSTLNTARYTHKHKNKEISKKKLSKYVAKKHPTHLTVTDRINYTEKKTGVTT